MGQRIRSRMTFANVVSLAALFVALGGTATAVTYVVSSNSQIGPGHQSPGHQPPSGEAREHHRRNRQRPRLGH